MTTNKLLTELLRPKTLDGLKLLPRIKNELSSGLVQNVLLSGPPGVGKSSIANILTEGYDTLKLNGSAENGIDIIRNQVVSFASSISLENGSEKIKVIRIEECDGLTTAAWDALRDTIEKYADNVRYVCNCNKFEKIPSFIVSRFRCIKVYPIDKEEEKYLFDEYCEYIGTILKSKTINITYTEDTLREFVKNYFPDMRSILNTIQSLYLQGAHTLDKNSIAKTFDCSDLFEQIINVSDPVENYKFVMSNYSSSPEDALLAISHNFVEYIRQTHPEYCNKVALIIVAIAEYLQQLATSPDQVIVLLACIYKLQIIIHEKQLI